MMDLMEHMEAYAKAFGDGFPMIPIGWGRSDEEVCEIIDECIKKKKTVYQLGYAKDSEDIEY